MTKIILFVRGILGLVALSLVASCAAPSVTRDEARRLLEGGGYAMIYAGAYQVDTGIITSSRTVTPGTIKLFNQARNEQRTIDSAGKGNLWGGVAVPAGTWRLREILTASNGPFASGVTSSTPLPDDAAVTVAPGEVVYIGQFEVAAPSVSGMFAARKLTRRDNFATFRSELDDTEPDLAARVVYRPLRSAAIVDAN